MLLETNDSPVGAPSIPNPVAGLGFSAPASIPSVVEVVSWTTRHGPRCHGLIDLDLMDLLAMYRLRASAPLDAMAKLCGDAFVAGLSSRRFLRPDEVDERT